MPPAVTGKLMLSADTCHLSKILVTVLIHTLSGKAIVTKPAGSHALKIMWSLMSRSVSFSIANSMKPGRTSMMVTTFWRSMNSSTGTSA